MASGGGSVPTVLLGLEDAPLSPAEESRSDLTVSRLGGRPDWPADLAPPPPQPACDRCGRPQPLVTQIYAPIGASAYHRTLYLFACVSPECANESGAWRCLRAQQRAAAERSEPESTARASQPATAAAAADWLDSADDWGDGDGGWGDDDGEVDNSSAGGIDNVRSNTGTGGGEDNLQTLTPSLQKLALDVDNANLAASGDPPAASAEVEPASEEGVSPEPVAPPTGDLRALLAARPAPPAGTVTFRPTYLSVIEEPAPRAAASHHELDLLRQYQAREGVNMAQLSAGGGGGGGGTAAAAAEVYERAAPAHGDRLLYKLIQRLELCPAQVLRYGRDGGAPLPLAPLPAGWAPVCAHCGGPAVFELQLLPTLVSRLRAADSQGAERTGLLEFGTAIVYTCRDSCWRAGDRPRTETVLVQAEMQ
ncbi:programmed cell death protein 2-like [Amphibalanus amphitrite]|uniref:programmed cell death protein 2-like n=1 Tax=Amphibalanus amphitrite TaxID=1232801 RepID=UPI001C907336|nr:programmed cell death protein 2-like [Amphibalanus amphitrite]XP_043238621.1 programmed cell death protein 2-like [Amphibalanus amphitrite]